MASLGIQLGFAAASAISGFIKQHEIRLTDAKNEDAAAASLVPQVQQFLLEVVDAYEHGEISPSEAVEAVTYIDQTAYQYLRSQVGKPGTSWNSSQPGKCDRTCTVGCCLYNSNIHIWTSSLIAVLQQGGGAWKMNRSYPSKYGYPGSDPVVMTISKPNVSKSVEGQIESAVDSLLGIRGTDSASALRAQGFLAPAKFNAKSLAIIGAGILVLVVVVRK